MYVRSSAQARTSRCSLRRRRRLDVYARACIQYRLGTCETPITPSRSFYTCMSTHARMRTWSSTCMCMHARMRRLVWSGDGTYVRRRRPWSARGKICACAFLVILLIHTSTIQANGSVRVSEAASTLYSSSKQIRNNLTTSNRMALDSDIELGIEVQYIW